MIGTCLDQYNGLHGTIHKFKSLDLERPHSSHFALLEHCPESMMLEKPQMKDHSERDPAVGLSQPTLPLNSAATGANPCPLTNPKTHKK